MVLQEFQFVYNGRRGVYTINITIDKDQVRTSCTCISAKPCKHIRNVLIGRRDRLRNGDASMSKMLEALSEIAEGRKIIEDSRAFFQQEDTCRRCNSKNIVDTKEKTIKARLFRAISSHRYYCRDCRWSW